MKLKLKLGEARMSATPIAANHNTPAAVAAALVAAHRSWHTGGGLVAPQRVLHATWSSPPCGTPVSSPA